MKKFFPGVEDYLVNDAKIHGKIAPSDTKTTPLRVLFVVESFDRGGAENQCALLANGLAERGHHTGILRLTDGPMRYAFCPEILIESSGIPRTDPRVVWKIHQAARRMEAAAVIAFLPVPIIWCRIWKVLFPGDGAVVCSISSVRYRPYPVWIAFETLLGRLDTMTLTNSENTKAFVSKLHPRGKEIHVLYNGVDTARFAPVADGGREARRELSISEQDFLVVMLASLQYVKGHALMLDALRMLRTDGRLPDNLRVSFVGGDRQAGFKADIERRIAEYGLCGVVFLEGQTECPEKWLKAADCLALTSVWEGFPNVILEAMACGTPWVATPVSDLPALARQSDMGIALRDHTPETLAQAIASMANKSGEERAHMGQKGVEWVRHHCAKEAVIGQFEKLLQTTIGCHA